MPVFALNDLNFWLQMGRYFVCVFIAYFIPGDLVLSRMQLPKIFRIPLAITIGMVLLAFEGYIFGYFHIRYLSLVYITICVIAWLFLRKKLYVPVVFKVDKLALLLIAVGAVAQLTTIWFSGYMVGGRATYCCGDPNDNFFYGTISREITHEFPPDQPGMTGVEFKNYHYWSNIVVGETARIFNIPVFQLQYQYSTILLSVLVGLLLLALCNEIKGSKVFARWVLFFFYFGSDAIYWFILLRRSGFMFSMSSLEDGVGLFANYPRALAVIVSIAAITLLFYLKKRFSWKILLVTALLFGSVAGMKIYLGFFCYVGLICLSIYEIIKKSKKVALLVGLFTLLFFIPIYLSANAGAGGLYYTGFWRAQNFIVQPNLNLIRYELARKIYEADHKWIQVMVFNIGFTALYFTLIFGTKMIAFFNGKRSLRSIPAEFHVFFIPVIIFSTLLGFFFNQDIGESNTFNFIISSFIFISFYAALYCSYITETRRKWVAILFTIMIVFLTMPRAVYRVYNNINGIVRGTGESMSSNMLDASRIIRKNTDANAMILVDNRAFYFDTLGPTFSMLIDRPMFLSGENFLRWFRAPEKEIERRKMVRNTIFSSKDILAIASVLKTNAIDYVITDSKRQFISTSLASFYEHWYVNPEILVIKVHRELIPTDIFDQIIESTTASALRYHEIIAPYITPYTNNK